MFAEYEEYQSQPQRTMLLSLNGNNDSEILTLQYNQKEITMSDIKRKAELDYQIVISNLRLFTQQGVEIYQEDLPYLRDGILLCVSDNADFDSYSQFNVYQILKVLGEGGFGKVLLGKHKVTGELYAIKVIDSGQMWNAADIDLLFREAELMKNLRHNNIIKVINCYTLPNMQVVLVMEYLQGGDLVDYLQEKGKLSEEEAKVIFKQIADAIRYCHEKRLIHRDLKLENILLTSKHEKQIKIIDFGIATVALDFVMDKIDIGSLSYMAPEVLSGQLQKVKASIDIWALGVILFTLCCGYLPFNGNSQQQTIQNITSNNYFFPSFALSREYKDLVQQMLNPDYTSRVSIYDVLNHPWLKRFQGNTLTAPAKLLNAKPTLKRDASKQSLARQLVSPTMIKRDVTSASMARVASINALSGGVTSFKAFQNQTIQNLQSMKAVVTVKVNDGTQTPPVLMVSPEVASPKSLANLDQPPHSPSNSQRNSFVVEPEAVQDVLKSVKRRKLSDFNQKLVDRLFREDRLRQQSDQKERKKRIILSQSQAQKLQSPIRNHTAQSQMRCSTRQHSLANSAEQSKRLKQKRICLKTIIDLTHRPLLTGPAAQPSESCGRKRQSLQSNNIFTSLYQLQANFRHRKMNSEALYFQTFKQHSQEHISVRGLYNSLFSKKY